MSDSATISPTAHYTGYVWSRNGLSHPALATTEGRVLFDSLHPLMLASARLGRPSLESYLLARHLAIDALLERAIERDGVTQVLEVEADLPAMAQRKRAALRRIGSLDEHHQVHELDALKDSGPASVAALAAALDHEAGLVIITEGLLGYVSSPEMHGIWRRFAAALSAFRVGRYISDLHLARAQTPEVRAFRVVLSAFVRGRVYLHFTDAQEAEAALREDGFATASVRPANAITGDPKHRGAQMAHILEASTFTSSNERETR